MPDQFVQLSFNLFSPSAVLIQQAQDIARIADREEFRAVKEIVEAFRQEMTQRLITTRNADNEVFRGAVLALQDIETVLNNAKDLAFIRAVHETRKEQPVAKWKNL